MSQSKRSLNLRNRRVMAIATSVVSGLTFSASARGAFNVTISGTPAPPALEGPTDQYEISVKSQLDTNDYSGETELWRYPGNQFGPTWLIPELVMDVDLPNEGIWARVSATEHAAMTTGSGAWWYQGYATEVDSNNNLINSALTDYYGPYYWPFLF